MNIITVGFIIGFLLNLTGWLGNNFLLRRFWRELKVTQDGDAWRRTIWRHVFSFLPDFLYGFAIAWLCAQLQPQYPDVLSSSLRAGLFVSLVGGITTYFAIANSGFIRWKLAFASFALVLLTKLPLAILAGKLLII